MQKQKIIPIHDVLEDEAANACSSGEPYALMVLGDSMLPEFENGDIIVVEPEGLARDDSFVVAFHNEEYTFRQLLIREGETLSPRAQRPLPQRRNPWPGSGQRGGDPEEKTGQTQLDEIIRLTLIIH